MKANRKSRRGWWVGRKFAVALVRCYEAVRRHKRDSELGTKFLKGQNVVNAWSDDFQAMRKGVEEAM